MPASITDGTRASLGFDVASIPAFGHLAQVSRDRYGQRRDDSRSVREVLCQQFKRILPPNVQLKLTDTIIIGQ